MRKKYSKIAAYFVITHFFGEKEISGWTRRVACRRWRGFVIIFAVFWLLCVNVTQKDEIRPQIAL